jgi:hypothetical protein
MHSARKRSKTDKKRKSKKTRHESDTKTKHSAAKNEEAVQEETEANDVDDIVEDFQFSDLDE